MIRKHDGKRPLTHGLLVFDLVVLPLEVDGAGEVASLILRERLHLVLELLDRDVPVDHGLLFRFDHLVQVAQLRVEPGQRHPLFVQAAFRLAVLHL